MKDKKNKDGKGRGASRWLTTAPVVCIIGTIAVAIGVAVVLLRFDSKDHHDLFQKCDSNSDGVLDREEFDACSRVLAKSSKISSSQEFEDDFGSTTDPEILRVEPFFEKLLFETMQTGKEGGIYGISSAVQDTETLTGLLRWKNPNKTHVDISISDLSQFLPPGRHMPLGKPWLVYFQPQMHLTSDRYNPPESDGIEEVLTRLLGAFHPRPFVYTRFGPHGGFATTRAVNEKYYHIMFRFHAEFQLNEEPVLPFWFSPSQFLGEMIITRDGTHVEYFNIHVPNERKLNVDMEWLTARTNDGMDDMQVDIGYMPRMELRSKGPSVTDVAEFGSMGEQTPESFSWREHISKEEAESALEKALYPFKKVEYLQFDEVFDRAKVEDKLVHNILLWGSLDDQSC